MPTVYETMRRAEIQDRFGNVRFVLRLWVDGHDLAYANHALTIALALAADHDTTSQAAQTIADGIPHLNAVEVLDNEGNGSLVYPDWP